MATKTVQEALDKAMTGKEATETSEEKKESPGEPEDDLVTILHGWGRVAPGVVNQVDSLTFVGGVCRNVPRSTAKALMSRTHTKNPEKPKHGFIKGYIVSNDAVDADFVKATGIQPLPIQKFAAMLGAFDADTIRQALGDEKALTLAKDLLKTYGLKV